MKGLLNIELGGKVRQLKFGNMALLDIIERFNLADANTATPVKYSYEFVSFVAYAALRNNAYFCKGGDVFTEQGVAMWCDEASLSDLKQIFVSFCGSINDSKGEKNAEPLSE